MSRAKDLSYVFLCIESIVDWSGSQPFPLTKDFYFTMEICFDFFLKIRHGMERITLRHQ